MSHLRSYVHRPRERGFTLLEAVVAFAILAIALGVLYAAFAESVDRVYATERKQAAFLLARSLLAGASVAASATPGIRRGETADGMRWEIEVDPYSEADRTGQGESAGMLHPPWPLQAFEVTVRVHWGSRASQTIDLRSLQLEGVR